MGQNLYRLGATGATVEKSASLPTSKGRIDIKGAGGIRDLATVRALPAWRTPLWHESWRGNQGAG